MMITTTITDKTEGVNYPVTLNSSVTDYLCNRFTIQGIRKDISRAELVLAVVRQFGDIDDILWWEDYLRVCHTALDIIRSLQPKPTPRPGNHRIDIESIKRSNDIVSVVERYTKLHKSGKRLTGICPLHSEKTASFFVYPDNQTWHCYGSCNTGGDVISFVMLAENTDFRGAAAILEGN